MILQNIIMPDKVCTETKIFYQSNEILNYCENCIYIQAKKKVSFFSYMNMFDLDAWKKYTNLEKVVFCIKLKGCGFVFLKTKTKDYDKIITSFCFNTREWMDYCYEIRLEHIGGCCYFDIQTETEVLVRNACFTTADTAIENTDIKIALNICTYRRSKEIKQNLEKLKSSRFFHPSNELYEKLQIMIVDNGSELEKMNEPCVRLVHNLNTGGSGGFKRGLEEIVRWYTDTTHVVFMDDDVELNLESLYRLYALLSYISVEYDFEAIAGRMFRTDNRHVQYTAAEIWNRGNLLHIGLNADMTLQENIICANQNENAEYGGWWFCCYPMNFAKDNEPLPFFVHCDDVEYGLRHGGTPIILNGIQVWHETYEYRQSSIIAYYDMRNSLIVNKLYGMEQDKKLILYNWKMQITKKHIEGKYDEEYILICALRDYMRGISWLKRVNSNRLHSRLCNVKSSRLRNALAWRFTEILFKRREKQFTLEFLM